MWWSMNMISDMMWCEYFIYKIDLEKYGEMGWGMSDWEMGWGMSDWAARWFDNYTRLKIPIRV